MYSEYEDLLKEIGATKEGKIIDKEIEKINSVIYKSNSNSWILSYVGSFYQMMDNDLDLDYCERKLKAGRNQLNDPNVDAETKEKINRAIPTLEEEIQNYKNDNIKLTKDSQDALNKVSEHIDSSDLSDEQKEKLRAALKSIRDNFTNIMNKVNDIKKTKANHSTITINEKTKRDSVIDKIKNGYKKGRRKVIAVKDWAVDRGCDLKGLGVAAYAKVRAAKDWTFDKAGRVAGWTADKARDVKDWTVNAAGNVKDWTATKAGQIKDFAVEGYGKVKDGIVKFAKNHKVSATLLALALAGLIGATISFGTPLAGVARCASGLYMICKHFNIMGPLPYFHKFNEFILGKIAGATFTNDVNGFWMLNGRILNDMTAFGAIFRSLELVTAAGFAGYGLYKVGKFAWKKAAEAKLGTRLKENMQNIVDASVSKIKKINPLSSRYDEDIYEKYMEYDSDELDEVISDLKEAKKSWVMPTGWDKKTLLTNLAMAKKARRAKRKEEKEEQRAFKKYANISDEEIIARITKLKEFSTTNAGLAEPFPKEIVERLKGLEDWEDVEGSIEFLEELLEYKKEKGKSR